jgi:hypothetical protein
MSGGSTSCSTTVKITSGWGSKRLMRNRVAKSNRRKINPGTVMAESKLYFARRVREVDMRCRQYLRGGTKRILMKI